MPIMHDLPDLRNKRCLVTGGSRGLGRAICLGMARTGAKVAFTYAHDDGDAEDTRAALAEAMAVRAGDADDPDEQLQVYKGSVADRDHVRHVVRDLNQRWGGVDVLVACAGVTQVLPLALIEEEEWDEVMDVNAKGAFLFSRAVAKGMIRARSGRILYIGNFSSERLIEAPVHFAAAKAALRGLTEAMAREVGRYGVSVNLLAPGLLDVGLANMLPQHRIEEYLDMCPMRRLGRVDELAEVALFLISEQNSFMTGAKVVVDGGL